MSIFTYTYYKGAIRTFQYNKHVNLKLYQTKGSFLIVYGIIALENSV